MIKAFFFNLFGKPFGKNDTKYTRYKNWSDGKVDIIFGGRRLTFKILHIYKK